MSTPTDAYPPGNNAAIDPAYEAADRLSDALPGQMARVRREAEALRERLEFPNGAANTPGDAPSAREKAAASDG